MAMEACLSELLDWLAERAQATERQIARDKPLSALTTRRDALAKRQHAVLAEIERYAEDPSKVRNIAGVALALQHVGRDVAVNAS